MGPRKEGIRFYRRPDSETLISEGPEERVIFLSEGSLYRNLRKTIIIVPEGEELKLTSDRKTIIAIVGELEDKGHRLTP